MVYKKDSWISIGKTMVEKASKDKPTAGLPWALAAILYLRDGLLADHTKNGQIVRMSPDTVKESFNELFRALVADGVDDGFLSNASAAAKAAGYKGNEAAKLDANAIDALLK